VKFLGSDLPSGIGVSWTKLFAIFLSPSMQISE
jgi:hypothetical protein